MKSKMLICLICLETATALYFAAAAAASYGRAVPLPCLKSRCANGGQAKWSDCKSECLAIPMQRTRALRTFSTVNGKTRLKMRISPMASRGESQSLTGWATWYSRQSCQREGTSGVLTASGRKYDENSMTCALWITNKNGRPLKPDGRLVKISRVGSSRTLTVAWTDNGPGRVPRNRGVICDLTPTAFKALGGNLRDGKIKVTVEKL